MRNTEESYQLVVRIPHWMELADFSALVQKRTKWLTSAEDFYKFLKLDFLRSARSDNVYLKIWLESSLLKMCLYWRIKQKDMSNYRPVRYRWFRKQKMKPYFTGLRIKNLKETIQNHQYMSKQYAIFMELQI